MYTSDFPTWELMLTTAVSNGKESLDLLIDAVTLIYEILENGEFPEPIRAHTQRFVGETIPQTVNEVLKLKYLTDDVYDVFLDFVQLCLTLAVYAASQPGKFMCDSLLNAAKEILKDSQPFYSYKSRKWCEVVCKTFVVGGDWQLLLDTLVSDLGNLSVYRACVGIAQQMMSVDTKLVSDENLTMIIKVMSAFCEQLLVGENLSKCQDFSTLTATIDECVRLFCSGSRDKDTRMFFPLINVAVRSEKITQQLFGIDVIKKLASSHVAMQDFGEWARDSGFLTYLVTKQFNRHVVPSLADVFSELARYHVADDSLLDQLWNMVLTVHSSEKELWTRILVTTIFAGNKTAKERFLGQLVAGDMTNEKISVLAEIVATSGSPSEEITTRLFNEAKVNEFAYKTLLGIVQSRCYWPLAKCLTEKCLEELKGDGAGKIAKGFLPYLVSSLRGQAADARNEMIASFFDVIERDRALVLDVLGRLLPESTLALTPEQIERLAANKDDQFWALMRTLLDLRGAEAVTDTGFELLQSIVDEFDFTQSTQRFAGFLWSFILVMNCRAGNVADSSNIQSLAKTKAPVSYVFCSYPLYGVDYAFRLLTMGPDAGVMAQAERYILNLCPVGCMSEMKQVNSFLDDNYLKVLFDIEDSAKIKYMSSLLVVLKGVERLVKLGPDTFLRHVIPDGFVFVNLDCGSKSICLVEDGSDDLWKLGDRVAGLMVVNDSYYFTEANSYINRGLLLRNAPKDTLGVVRLQLKSNKNCFDMKNADQSVIYPSMYLAQHEFADKIYEFLSNSSLQEASWGLLSFLPDAPRIVNSIRSNIEDVLGEMRSGNVWQVRYCIECVLNSLRCKTDTGLPFPMDARSSFIKIFLDQEPSEAMCGFLELLLVITSSDFPKEFFEPLVKQSFLYLCLDYCKAKSKAADLLQKLLANFKETTVIVDNIDLFQRVIDMADTTTWPTVKDAILNTTELAPLFKHLVTQKGNAETVGHSSGFTVDMLASMLPKLEGKVETSQVLSECIKLVLVENGETLTRICDMATSILMNDASATNFPPSLVRDIMLRCFATADMDVQNSLVKLCYQMTLRNTESMAPIVELLKEKAQYSTSSWSYAPAQYQRGLAFNGLTNLGATCYMNSILQQLYHIEPFRELILKNEFEAEDQKELQKLFASLGMSAKPVIDTRPFCNVWKGWGNTAINVREQQDAGEFLNLFLDQLPQDCQALLKLSLVNKIEGITEKYETENIETMFTLPLDVKGLSDISASFDSFLEAENFCGQDGLMTPVGKIDCKKFARIRAAPKVLAIQLKRFEYDLRYGHYKVTDHFSFPEKINISTLMDNANDECNFDYELKGVVLHSGSVDAGHYISLVKINGEWYKFNDGCVSQFTAAELEHEAFGGRTTGFCASLLFYSQFSSDEASIMEVPESLKADINLENQAFLEKQVMFSYPILSLFAKFGTLPILLSYLFNIFAHSALDIHSGEISTAIMDQVRKENQQQDLFNYFFERVSDLIDVYRFCSRPEIIAVFHKVIDAFVTRETCQADVVPLCNAIMASWPTFLSLWRQYDAIAEIPVIVARSVCSSLSDETKREWSKITEEFLVSIYSATVSSAVREYVSTQNLFDLLRMIWHSDHSTKLLDHWDAIEQNVDNALRFLLFLLESEQKFDIERGVKYCLARKVTFDNKAFCMFVIDVICHTDCDITTVLFAYRDPLVTSNTPLLQLWLSEIQSGNVILKQNLLKGVEKLVLPFLLDSVSDVRLLCFDLISELFDRMPWFDVLRHSRDQRPVNDRLTWEKWFSDPKEEEQSALTRLYNGVLDLEPQVVSFLTDSYSSHGYESDKDRVTPVIVLTRWLKIAVQSNSPECLRILRGYLDICRRSTQPHRDKNLRELFLALVTFPPEMILADIPDLVQLICTAKGDFSFVPLSQICDAIPTEILEAIITQPMVVKSITSLIDERSHWYQSERNAASALLSAVAFDKVFETFVPDPNEAPLGLYYGLFAAMGRNSTPRHAVQALLVAIRRIPKESYTERSTEDFYLLLLWLISSNTDVQQAWSEVSFSDDIEAFKRMGEYGLRDLIWPLLEALAMHNAEFSQRLSNYLLDNLEVWGRDHYGLQPRYMSFLIRASLSEDQQASVVSSLLQDTYYHEVNLKLIGEVIKAHGTITPCMLKLLERVLLADNVSRHVFIQDFATLCIEKLSDESLDTLISSLAASLADAKACPRSRQFTHSINALAFISNAKPDHKPMIVDLVRASVTADLSTYDTVQAFAILFS